MSVLWCYLDIYRLHQHGFENEIPCGRNGGGVNTSISMYSCQGNYLYLIIVNQITKPIFFHEILLFLTPFLTSLPQLLHDVHDVQPHPGGLPVDEIGGNTTMSMYHKVIKLC